MEPNVSTASEASSVVDLRHDSESPSDDSDAHRSKSLPGSARKKKRLALESNESHNSDSNRKTPPSGAVPDPIHYFWQDESNSHLVSYFSDSHKRAIVENKLRNVKGLPRASSFSGPSVPTQNEPSGPTVVRNYSPVPTRNEPSRLPVRNYPHVPTRNEPSGSTVVRNYSPILTRNEPSGSTVVRNYSPIPTRNESLPLSRNYSETGLYTGPLLYGRREKSGQKTRWGSAPNRYEEEWNREQTHKGGLENQFQIDERSTRADERRFRDSAERDFDIESTRFGHQACMDDRRGNEPSRGFMDHDSAFGNQSDRGFGNLHSRMDDGRFATKPTRDFGNLQSRTDDVGFRSQSPRLDNRNQSDRSFGNQQSRSEDRGFGSQQTRMDDRGYGTQSAQGFGNQQSQMDDRGFGSQPAQGFVNQQRMDERDFGNLPFRTDVRSCANQPVRMETIGNQSTRIDHRGLENQPARTDGNGFGNQPTRTEDRGFVNQPIRMEDFGNESARMDGRRFENQPARIDDGHLRLTNQPFRMDDRVFGNQPARMDNRDFGNQSVQFDDRSYGNQPVQTEDFGKRQPRMDDRILEGDSRRFGIQSVRMDDGDFGNRSAQMDKGFGNELARIDKCFRNEPIRIDDRGFGNEQIRMDDRSFGNQDDRNFGNQPAQMSVRTEDERFGSRSVQMEERRFESSRFFENTVRKNEKVLFGNDEPKFRYSPDQFRREQYVNQPISPIIDPYRPSPDEQFRDDILWEEEHRPKPPKRHRTKSKSPDPTSMDSNAVYSTGIASVRPAKTPKTKQFVEKFLNVIAEQSRKPPEPEPDKSPKLDDFIELTVIPPDYPRRSPLSNEQFLLLKEYLLNMAEGHPKRIRIYRCRVMQGTLILMVENEGAIEWVRDTVRNCPLWPWLRLSVRRFDEVHRKVEMSMTVPTLAEDLRRILAKIKAQNYVDTNRWDIVNRCRVDRKQQMVVVLPKLDYEKDATEDEGCETHEKALINDLVNAKYSGVTYRMFKPQTEEVFLLPLHVGGRYRNGDDYLCNLRKINE